MRGSDPNATIGDGLVHDRLEHCLALALANTHFLSAIQAKTAECRGVHPSGRGARITGTLQGWRAAHDRIGKVNRYVGNPFDGR